VTSVQRLCDQGIRWGLVALIVFTPLAFGTVEPWSIALMEWGITTLVLLYILERLWPVPVRSTGTPPQGRPHLLGLALPIGLFMVLCLLQTVPVPMHWLRVLSPGSARMYESVDVRTWETIEDKATEARSSLQDPLLQLRSKDRRPVSVNPARTRDRVLLLATLVALFFLVSRWADEERTLFILRSVTAVAFLVAVFGLVQLFTWNGRIYWVRKVPSMSATSPTAFGPFVNHDHFAGYVEMAIPTALSLAFWLMAHRPRTQAIDGPDESGDPLATPPRGGPGDDARNVSQGLLTLFAAVILIVSLFFSLSRGGILSAFISGSVLVIMLFRRAASPALRWSLGLALPLVVILLISWIGADAVRKQLGTYENLSGEASFRMRVVIWGRVIRELPAYVWVGSGLGTFEDSFAPLTPTGSARRWDKAHNDYLQLVWETGLAGAVLFLAGALVFGARYWWPAILNFRQPFGPLRVGIAVALMSIAIHSLVDFCLQIGANGFLCALLAGLLVAIHTNGDQVELSRRSVGGRWLE
jgi:O-antigen ligase